MIHLLLVVIYLAFIGLGLPDSLLGSAWPSMYGELNVPVSYAGVISMTIALGTVVSALLSDRLSRRFSAGVITAVNTAIMSLSMFGFSISRSFLMLWFFAIPYGLGAGSVDAALNNYVAIHFSSRHMSWLHCMWGIGTVVGPNVMGYVLTQGMRWSVGYGVMAIIQGVLAVVLFVSLPLWKKKKSTDAEAAEEQKQGEALPLLSVIKIPGAKEIMLTFFCYCAVEQTAMLWGSSYLNLHGGMSVESAARLAGMFYIGITAGRAVNGFLTIKFTDTQMVRAGQAIIALGIVFMLLPFKNIGFMVGLILVGVGCAPIYPSCIHSTPAHFGAENSQAIIGVEMASAYVGTCLMPPLFGLIAQNISIALFPVYLLVILVLMVVMHERLVKCDEKHRSK